jgi:hypothetical protein
MLFSSQTGDVRDEHRQRRLTVASPASRTREPSARKSNPVLCQNCVRYPRKPRSNTVIQGAIPMRIVVAGSR